MTPLLALAAAALLGATPPASPAKPEAKAPDPDAEVIANLELLERLELLQNLDMLEPAPPKPRPPPAAADEAPPEDAKAPKAPAKKKDP